MEIFRFNDEWIIKNNELSLVKHCCKPDPTKGKKVSPKSMNEYYIQNVKVKMKKIS